MTKLNCCHRKVILGSTHEGQEAARLAHGTAVSQEADDEDEGSGSDEDVAQL